DKLREWKAKGWRVGIVTGDIAEDIEAPLIVATLETQKPQFLEGIGPDLFVVDEYQMIADPIRGVNYELTIAMAPEDTQLLLLSGSVSNPKDVVEWLRRIGRAADLVSEQKRPVPLEQVFLDALPFNPPRTVTGYWPRLIAKALMSDLGPILIFAPQRKAAERLAKQLAGALPQENPLPLTGEQKRLAGPNLSKLLPKRVAYHHSGLSYQQRAGLVEPLAKAGQLRIVVSTTGLAAGVNFSMRSALVTESEYTVDHVQQLIRPDELLQMFGRAGRRGLDEVGYALVAPDRPRLNEARPLPIKRSSQLDWPSLLSVMDAASRHGKDPFDAAREACRRLFDTKSVEINIERPEGFGGSDRRVGDEFLNGFQNQERMELRNSRGEWEALPAARKIALSEAKVFREGQWVEFETDAESVRGIGRGGLSALNRGKKKRFGKKVRLAYPDTKRKGLFELAGWFRKALARESGSESAGVPKRWSRDELLDLPIERIEKALNPGIVKKRFWERGRLNVLISVGAFEAEAMIDSHGVGLIEPETRKAFSEERRKRIHELTDERDQALRRSPTKAWVQLGLIEGSGALTRRGLIFSYFQGGEGLAIAAALEDMEYAVDAIAHDIANLRAGFRFDDHSNYSYRLARACRRAYQDRSYSGYLEHGLPPHYGEGAAEVIADLAHRPGLSRRFVSETLRMGDVQRARLEWLSLLRHIKNAPGLEWERWRELKQAVETILETDDKRLELGDLPPLEPSQQGRVNHRLRFR
ncbi:MAG: helicase-related protein, partial [Verrucomicrobiota bacterium]